MNYEQRDNTGAIFANTRREKDSHPTHQGSCKIGGRDYYISAWVKESKGGGRYFSLSFKPKMAQDYKGAPANPPAPKAEPQEFNDEIPFAWAIALPIGALLAIACAALARWRNT